MNRPSNPILLLVLMLFTVAGGAAVLIWRSSRNDQRQQSIAAKLIESGSTREALEIINAQGNVSPPSPWFSMKVECLVALRRVESMKALYYQHPSYFSEDESAALVVARCLSNQGSDATYNSLRNQWRGKEENSRAWLALDVDGLVRTGRTDAAIKTLEANSLPSGRNSGRLTRLALLNASDGNRAWNYLEEAYRDNSRDPSVRLFRGQLLEASGRISEARVEYVAACVADRGNPAMHDQLAQFYRRRGNLFQAMTTWTQGVQQAPADFLEYSVLFWGRIGHPTDLDWAGRQLSSGRCQTLVQYLVTLPQNEFWDERLWQEMMQSAAVDSEDSQERHDSQEPNDSQESDEGPRANIAADVSRPEIAWLRVMHFLRSGELNRARLSLREASRDLEPLQPELFRSLVMTLDYHLTGFCDPNQEWKPIVERVAKRHRFLMALDTLHRSERREAESLASNDAQKTEPNENSSNTFGSLSETTSFTGLTPRDSIVACLLANGWVEAAIRMDDPFDAGAFTERPQPTWLQYALAQARRMNDGPQEALDYIARCPQSPELSLVESEILLGAGRFVEAEDQLSRLCERRDAIGRRAAWLLCIQWIEQERFADVQRVLKLNAPLGQSVVGKELLARALYAEGKSSAATDLLAQIQPSSPQATAFLARQAFQNRDFEESQRLTRDLQRQLPDSMAVRANLQQIEAARNESN